MTPLTRLRAALADWYQTHRRDLPWRRTRDPYAIWISEIMLQQTRVAAVIPYYDRFLTRFPTVEALAAAPEPDLLAAWAGLGYYSRARNLQAAARQIAALGHFPRSYDEIRSLKGVGDYTAAAVASIAFGLPHAVVDGNVIRVLARLDADAGDVLATATRARLRARADALLDPADPSTHNQALMELGAVICTPRDPACPHCPWAAECQAFAAGIARELPIKSRRMAIHRVDRALLIIHRGGDLLLWQRPADAPKLAGFWELPEPHQLPEALTGASLHRFKHSITNHIYDFEVIQASLDAAPEGFAWVTRELLETLPLSTTTRKALAGLVQKSLFV